MYVPARDFAGMKVFVIPDAEIAVARDCHAPQEGDRDGAIESRPGGPGPGDRLDARDGLCPPGRMAPGGLALVSERDDLQPRRVLPDQPARSQELPGVHAPSLIQPRRHRADHAPCARRHGPRGVRGRARRGVRPLDRGRWRPRRPTARHRTQRSHRFQRTERLDRRRSPAAADPAGRAAPGHPRRRGQGIRRRSITSFPGP